MFDDSLLVKFKLLGGCDRTNDAMVQQGMTH